MMREKRRRRRQDKVFCPWGEPLVGAGLDMIM
jgi:hypothetical protein